MLFCSFVSSEHISKLSLFYTINHKFSKISSSAIKGSVAIFTVLSITFLGILTVLGLYSIRILSILPINRIFFRIYSEIHSCFPKRTLSSSRRSQLASLNCGRSYCNRHSKVLSNFNNMKSLWCSLKTPSFCSGNWHPFSLRTSLLLTLMSSIRLSTSLFQYFCRDSELDMSRTAHGDQARKIALLLNTYFQRDSPFNRRKLESGVGKENQSEKLP